MKKLLAIDTSTEHASVALLVDGVSISEEQGSQKTQAQVLLPMIDELLTKADLRLNQLDGIVFGCGPGSFTGLRIACSIAKGLAYAHDLPLIPVSSLASLAWAARQAIQDDKAIILSVLDARMNELYWSLYLDSFYETKEQVNKPEDLVLPQDTMIVLAGVGIDVYWERFPEAIKSVVKCKLNIFPSAKVMNDMVASMDIKPVALAQAQPVYVRNQVTQGASGG